MLTENVNRMLTENVNRIYDENIERKAMKKASRTESLKKATMKGFFYEEKKPVKKVKTKSKKSKPKQGCDVCGLFKTCDTPKMKVSGLGKKKILIVGEAPGKSEDREGTQFVGATGRMLRNRLRRNGLSLDADCWKTNALICHPSNSVTPTAHQLGLCHYNLENTIEKLQPEKIILFGKAALQSFLFGRLSVEGIEKWVGSAIPDQKYGCWVFPTYHPQYLNYNQDDVVVQNIFDSNIRQAIDWKKKLPDHSKDDQLIVTLNDPKHVYEYLDSLSSGDTIFLDIETTGLRPYAKGHEIVSIAIMELEDKEVFVFPYWNDDTVFVKKLNRVMRSSKIKKVAHNLKFENSWLNAISNIRVMGWWFDTMLAAHILDSRTGITGLKHLTYVYEGVVGYDSAVTKFIQSKDKGANSFNRIKEADINDVLIYNGLDVLYTRMLYLHQVEEMNNMDRQAYNLFHQGILELANVEQSGVMIDSRYYHAQYNHLTKRMKKLNNKILKSDEAGVWKALHESDPKKFKEFNFASSSQLRILLFEELGYVSTRKTKKGNPSADQEALEGFDTPFVCSILEYRRLKKIRDTYLVGFMREQVNNYIHAFYNLNLARTYRSSSSNPNLQNVPKHDEQSQRLVRSGIIPRSGRQLVEVDYSGIEVRISACYHKDPVMIAYINNPDSDMHRDQAKELFLKDDITSQERFLAKNNFVFAEFYGDYYGNCAANIWKNLKESTIDHLVGVGLGSYSKFEKHVKHVEDIFWNEKFKVYKAWKEKTWAEYQQKGELSFYTKFRCSGHLSKNDVSNYRIQGTAFHCLLWSLIQLNKYLRKHDFETLIVGQVHDSILFDMVPNEKEELKLIIRRIMTVDIRKTFPWIIVPLDIDMEVSEVDGNWYVMKEEKI